MESQLTEETVSLPSCLFSKRVFMKPIISSILFGLGHLYQGRGGFFTTLILGTVFGTGRIVYDSLVPVVFWHGAVDLVAGVVGPRYLVDSTVNITK